MMGVQNQPQSNLLHYGLNLDKRIRSNRPLRKVDGKNEVITATDAATGDINEAHPMLPLLDKHQETTGIKAETVVAGSK